MAKLVWDESGKRLYETGVEKGVLYVKVKKTIRKGVAWNGLTAVTEVLQEQNLLLYMLMI